MVMKTEFLFKIVGFFNVFFIFFINYNTGVKNGQIHLYDMYECYTPKPPYIEKTKITLK